MVSKLNVKKAFGDLNEETLDEVKKFMEKHEDTYMNLFGKQNGTTDYYTVMGEIHNAKVLIKREAEETEDTDE